MKFHFFLRFYTKPGQALFLTGDFAKLVPIPLTYLNSECWQTAIDTGEDVSFPIHYSYQITMEDGSVIKEWGNDRIIDAPAKPMAAIQLVDTWNHAGEFENAFFTAPFQEILLPASPRNHAGKSPKTFSHLFKVKAPLTGAQEVVCLAGSGPGLREWSAENPVIMKREGNWWIAKVDIPPRNAAGKL